MTTTTEALEELGDFSKMLGLLYPSAEKRLDEIVSILREHEKRVEHLLTAAQEIRLDFAGLPIAEQDNWIHLPELRSAIDWAMTCK